MKRITCTKCGCKDAADFILKILCPQKDCTNYDSKLVEERREEKPTVDSFGSVYLGSDDDDDLKLVDDDD
jgi:hypothetical protein